MKFCREKAPGTLCLDKRKPGRVHIFTVIHCSNDSACNAIIQATLSGAIDAYSANSSINNSKEQFVDLWMSMMWPALYSSFTSGESLRDSISKSTEALDLAQQNHIQNVFSKNNLNNI